MVTSIAVRGNWHGHKGRSPTMASHALGQSVPLEVRGESIIVNSAAMAPGHFYGIELDGQQYIYRKNAENELEVYGLADS